MFYSHQLLSKKGPLGQIWIAATMRAKLSRKKAESLDIPDLCMQVLYPQVPLALRLSGILMGGIVAVYRRKVNLLYDDAQQFLIKVQIAITTEEKREVSINLPRGKQFARFEAITMDYTFDNYDEIEHLMLRPATPAREGDLVEEEDRIIIPRRRRSNAQGTGDANIAASSIDYAAANQAQLEDITLPEDLLCYEESLQNREFEDERFPPADDFFPPDDLQLDDFNLHEPIPVAEQPLETLVEEPMETVLEEPVETVVEEQMETVLEEPLESVVEKPLDTQVVVERASSPAPHLPAHTAGGSANETVQNSGRSSEPEHHIPAESNQPLAVIPVPDLPAEETLQEGPKSPEITPAPPPRKRRARQVQAPEVYIDVEAPEIAVQTFREWLEDSSDLVGRRTSSQRYPQEIHFETVLKLPSTGLSWKSLVDGPESQWPPSLLELWTQSISGNRKMSKVAPQEGNTLISDPTSTEEKQGVIEQASTEENNENEPSGQGDLNVPPAAHGMQAEATHMESVSWEQVLYEKEGSQDYGSVEKLRQALNTPATQNEIGNDFGFTPSVSGSHEGSAWSKRRGSTPVSGTLMLDPEIDLATSGRSKRRRHTHTVTRSASPGAADLPDGDMAPDFMDTTGQGDDATTLPGSLTQFELLEDSLKPSVQIADPKQSEDKITTQLLQYLRELFHSAQAPSRLSVNELTAGLEKYQAARLFYQITVLTSNRCLVAEQNEAYGDIFISPGQYL